MFKDGFGVNSIFWWNNWEIKEVEEGKAHPSNGNVDKNLIFSKVFNPLEAAVPYLNPIFPIFFPQLSQGSPEHQEIRVVCEELKHHIPPKKINPRDWEILGKNQLGNPWKNERKILKKKKKNPSGFEGVMQIYCIFWGKNSRFFDGKQLEFELSQL